MGDGPSESQAGDDPAYVGDEGVGYGNINTTTEQALRNDGGINENLSVQDVRDFRSANTPSFTQQSQNYVDDFSGANIGSLPTSRGTSTASLPISQTNMMQGTSGNQTFGGSDFNFANSNAAKGLREGAKGIGLPSFIPGSNLINTLTGLPSQMKLNALNRGQVPTYTDGMITGTKDFGFGNDPNVYPSIFADTAPQVQSFNNTINDGSDNNDPEIIRRRLAGEVIPEEELDPALSDDLAVNYLQDPYYLYSGQGNLYQPYGYAQGTLVDLLRTRNLTQPQQAAANLGLFGNPGDFS